MNRTAFAFLCGAIATALFLSAISVDVWLGIGFAVFVWPITAFLAFGPHTAALYGESSR